MIFKIHNNSTRSNDFVSTLLMFDVYSRMIETNVFSSTITQRATVMRKIMNEIRRLHAFRQMNDALNTRNDSFIISIHDLLINFSVLVFREDNTRQSETWKRSYKLLSLQDESTVVELSSELIKFRIISIKSYHNSADNDMKNTNEEKKNDDSIYKIYVKTMCILSGKSTRQIVAEVGHRQIDKLIVILHTKNRRAIYHLQASLIKKSVRLRCSICIKSKVYEYYLRVYEYDFDNIFSLKNSCSQKL